MNIEQYGTVPAKHALGETTTKRRLYIRHRQLGICQYSAIIAACLSAAECLLALAAQCQELRYAFSKRVRAGGPSANDSNASDVASVAAAADTAVSLPERRMYVYV